MSVAEGLPDYILLEVTGDDQTKIFKAIEQQTFNMPDTASQRSGFSISGIPEMVREMCDEIEMVKTESSEIKTQFNSLECSVASLASSVSDLEKTVVRFTEHIGGLESNVSGVRENVKSVVADLKDDVAGIRNSNGDLLTVLTTVKSDFTNVRFGLSNLASDVAGLKQASTSPTAMG